MIFFMNLKKNEFHTNFVQFYKTWYVCDDIYKKTYDFFAHFKLIWDYLCKCKFKGICCVFASLIYHWKKQNIIFLVTIAYLTKNNFIHS